MPITLTPCGDNKIWIKPDDPTWGFMLTPDQAFRLACALLKWSQPMLEFMEEDNAHSDTSTHGSPN